MLILFGRMRFANYANMTGNFKLKLNSGEHVFSRALFDLEMVNVNNRVA